MHDNPVLFVIFGISGDLAKRKLLPAMYRLLEQQGMPQNIKIVGISRQPDFTAETLFEHVATFIPGVDFKKLNFLKDHTLLFHNPLASESDGAALLNELEKQALAMGQGVQRLYYLSVPPVAFPGLVQILGTTGHNQPFANETSAPRILAEKPFGYDLHSAEALIESSKKYFDESQIYRIDHYLAKETAQNILAFRFKNTLFESVWNDNHIKSIEIAAHEQIDIEGRANFYDHTGALRDIVQSHLIQLLALVTMREPTTFTSDAIHEKKLQLLQAVRPANPAKASRGQYDGYREAVNNLTSLTETFARLPLVIDTDEWRNTAISLEAGKALSQKETYIKVTFAAKDGDDDDAPNVLTFFLQPTEGIALELQAKKPGLTSETLPVCMEFDYKRSFEAPSAEAYERVIMDAIRGDQSLFASANEVLASWHIVGDALTEWSKNNTGLQTYKKGSAASSIK